MSQRFTTELKPATVRRTLQRFWSVTREQPLIAALSVFTSAGYILLLTFANTYVMGLIVDRVQAGPVPSGQVVAVFWPYVAALVVVNLAGQILSKLQDYTVYKLEINGNYRLSRLCFNTLSNQSMTFHTNRFGGSLVSQTSRFTSGYTSLVDVTVYSLIPTITSVVCTVAVLAPAVPLFTAILVAIMVVYVAFVWYMYKKILPLSAATSKAQNRLSGVLSDAVTNILAVKTCGREDFERELFDAADRDARDAETVSMRAMMRRNFTTSGLIVLVMGIVSVFVAGGNAWFGISAGTLVVIFTYTYNLTMRLNYVSSMMQRINRALGDAAEMTRVLDEPLLVADAPGAPELRVSAGAIDFERLGFAYRDAAAGEKVFSDLTLHIPAGQRVGLVGRSGSGKTTLTKLLLRLDDVQDGRVLIDGQDVSACTQQSLRSQVAYVPQEALLFPAPSVRTSRTAARTPPGSRSASRRHRPTRSSSSTVCRPAWTRWWARGASSSPAASASALPLPAPSWPTARSSCSTRPRARSTPSPRRSCRTRSRTSCGAARPSSWRTASRRWPRSTASWFCPRAASWRTAPMRSSWPPAASTPGSGAARPAPSSRRSVARLRAGALPAPCARLIGLRRARRRETPRGNR